ncbi:hypothetical protein [Metabacillus idriensis]|uniref:hypothetical protein n=1 Tax=Metabacillus idriensis TaxID=324768 RepID=UPI00174A47DE|nr:hypothetical protein [Metabacillus idriensis]
MLRWITDDVAARLKKDWNASIQVFDKGENHLIMLADFLSAGIIKLFPDKFKNILGYQCKFIFYQCET